MYTKSKGDGMAIEYMNKQATAYESVLLEAEGWFCFGLMGLLKTGGCGEPPAEGCRSFAELKGLTCEDEE